MVEDKMAKANTGSEVIIFDEKAMVAHAAREMPNIASVHVSKSSKVHIGPKIVAVSQTVENKEMIKGHIFGLEVVSVKTSKRLRCSVAVFLCWAFLIASGITIYLVYFALTPDQVRLNIGLNASWYLRRNEWQALKEYKKDFLQLPVQYVIIGHSVGYYCNKKYACIKSMLSIQNDHFKRTWEDIGPNFLVGGNGIVFEGRGANVVGTMVKSWNLKSISIMFIGDYRTNSTEPKQFEHINLLLQTLQEESVLRPDYIVFGNCQIVPYTVSPGRKIIDNLWNVAHWNATNQEKCLPG